VLQSADDNTGGNADFFRKSLNVSVRHQLFEPRRLVWRDQEVGSEPVRLVFQVRP
jgi:hypothetical protein